MTESHLQTIDYKPSAPTSASSLPSGAMFDQKQPESTNTLDSSRDHDADADDEDDDARYDLYSEENEWDEGGKSHCGYSEMVHNTLMAVGKGVHNIVGEPSPRVEKELKAVGNWFQEASYAARDLLQGPNEGEASSGMQEDAWDAVKTLVRGGSKDKNDENADPNGSAVAAAEAAADADANAAAISTSNQPASA